MTDRNIGEELIQAAKEMKANQRARVLTSTLLHLNALILFVINLKLHTTAFYF